MAGLGPKWPPSVDLDGARTADLGSAVGLDRAKTAVLGGFVAWTGPGQRIWARTLCFYV